MIAKAGNLKKKADKDKVVADGGEKKVDSKTTMPSKSVTP
jgi:hypothetical protein